MTEQDKKKFKTVPAMDMDEYKQKIREHRLKILKRTLVTALIVFVIIAGLFLFLALRHYEDFDVNSTVERSDTAATIFEEFQGNILKYSNDGALYTDTYNERIWNQTYEMAKPTIDMCEDYLVIYDKKGTQIYIMTSQGLVSNIETTMTIEQVSIAAQGTVAVLMGDQSNSYLVVYDKNTLSTEELLQMRMDALKAEKESEFMTYCETNAARIYMPGDNIDYLDPFFDALEAARERPVRIMHYGDSQLEGDRISSVLREAFQERFGGSGVGLAPAVQTVPTYTLSQSVSPEGLSRHIVYGPKDMRLDSKAYGVMGQTATLDGPTTFRFSTRDRQHFPHASRFGQITLLTSAPVKAAAVAGTDTLILNETQLNDRFYCYSRNFSSPRTTVSLTVDGQADVYGVMLDGQTGVSLDNIPMRGCSGTIFTGIHSSTLSPFFGRENVRLIILQYGGNSVPYLKGKEGIDNYMSGLKRQIEYLRKLAPDACFLFIGPSDMSTSIDGEMQTYPILPRLVEAMKAMAEECGIAYWDLYAAMGGRGSMMKWVDAYLAGPDYVHFTPKGARHVGNILYETLEFYHKFYRFRTGKDKLKLSADSTELVVDTTQVPSVQATHTDTVSHDSLNP